MDVHQHPGGRDLKFSLNDNRLIACNSQKLHYPAPTEGAVSGRSKMPELNGPTYEYYEADEDIAILAIEQKTRSL